MRARTFYGVAVGVVVLAGGCGGDDKKSSSDAPTKAAYIAKADAICAAGKTQAKTYKDQLDALPANAQVKDTVPALEGELRVSRKAIAQLRGIKAPTEHKAMLDAYFAALDAETVAGDKLLAAARTNNLATLKRVGAGNPDLKAERRRIAERYGFKHCA